LRRRPGSDVTESLRAAVERTVPLNTARPPLTVSLLLAADLPLLLVDYLPLTCRSYLSVPSRSKRLSSLTRASRRQRVSRSVGSATKESRAAKGEDRHGWPGRCGGRGCGPRPIEGSIERVHGGPARPAPGAAYPLPTRVGRRRCSRGCCRFSGSSGTSEGGSSSPIGSRQLPALRRSSSSRCGPGARCRRRAEPRQGAEQGFVSHVRPFGSKKMPIYRDFHFGPSSQTVS
jgi:hypothetical protein